jgi:hypothetical protein
VDVLEFAKSLREIFAPIQGLILVNQSRFFSIPLSFKKVRNFTLGLRRKDKRLEELDKIFFNFVGKHSRLRDEKLAWAFKSKLAVLLPRILDAQHFEEHGRGFAVNGLRFWETEGTNSYPVPLRPWTKHEWVCSIISCS